MFKQQPVLEPIKLKLKLPENGTYPPRIVMPGETLWLRDNNVKAGKLTLVRDLHNNWKLLANDKHKILVNGQEIVIDTVLADGDYIRQGTWKGIFQADPVADYRQALQKEKVDGVIEVNPSQMLRDWVRLDYDGISLDGGETFTRWDEIIRIAFYGDNSSKWKVEFYTTTEDKKDKKIPAKLKDMTSEDFAHFITWVICHIPYHSSTFALVDDIWVDAYSVLAYEKLLIPAENNQRILPEKALKILRRIEEPTWKKLLFFVFVIGMLVGLGILLAKPSGFSLNSVIEVALAAVVIIGFFVVIQGLLWLERRYRQYKLNKLIAAEEARKMSIEKGE